MSNEESSKTVDGAVPGVVRMLLEGKWPYALWLIAAAAWLDKNKTAAPGTVGRVVTGADE